MTTLEIRDFSIPSATFGEESCLPPVAIKLSLGDISQNFHLDEDDGLFVGYGEVETAYPYRYQDMYGRELSMQTYQAAVLENENLKATFLPVMGGKLWSLYDKKAGKELLFANTVVRPCNLGVRNAWLSGGIEWNVGFRGHHPYTCSLVNTAQTKLDDGTPVLRFYYFERIRCAVVQMDFFLPENSTVLYTRVRITNPGNTVIPMYWWSNTAVGYGAEDRVIVPADQSYTAPDGEVVKIDIPLHNGIDVSYPHKNITSNDYFWKTDKQKRHYIAQLDKDGYGLCETSTSILKGRKLFIWGNSQGGSKWMNFLTADDQSGTYAEIQCGLAHTQYECLPMPPHTVWEWLETYGPLTADSKKVHGEWHEAQSAVEQVLDGQLPADHLAKLLVDTRTMANSPADILLTMDDGWGALELYRREKSGLPWGLMNVHLDFGSCGTAQADWLSLLENGTVGEHSPEAVPVSYMLQKEWLALLEAAVKTKDADNWYAHYLLGTAYLADDHFAAAGEMLHTSLALCPSPWGYYALAVCKKKTGDREAEKKYMLLANECRPNDLSLTKEVLRCLFEHEDSDTTIALFASASDEIRKNERCLLYYAYALARVGRLDEAEKILCGKDSKTFLVVPDIRECELTITQLWVYIHECRGLTREQMGEPPYDLDFRMFAAREGWF